MGFIDLKMDRESIGEFFKIFLDIPKWLKSLLIISISVAFLYFGIAQNYLYNDQIKELEGLKKELADTKHRITVSVISVEEYNKDFTRLIMEFSLIKEMFDRMILARNDQFDLILDYFERAHPNDPEIERLKKALERNEAAFEATYHSYLKYSILKSEEFKDMINKIPN